MRISQTAGEMPGAGRSGGWYPFWPVVKNPGQGRFSQNRLDSRRSPS